MHPTWGQTDVFRWGRDGVLIRCLACCCNHLSHQSPRIQHGSCLGKTGREAPSPPIPTTYHRATNNLALEPPLITLSPYLPQTFQISCKMFIPFERRGPRQRQLPQDVAHFTPLYKMPYINSNSLHTSRTLPLKEACHYQRQFSKKKSISKFGIRNAKTCDILRTTSEFRHDFEHFFFISNFEKCSLIMTPLTSKLRFDTSILRAGWIDPHGRRV